MSTTVEKELLSLREAAVMLGCSERHLWELARRRKTVPFVRLGGRILFSRRHLLGWIDAQASAPALTAPAEGQTDAKT